MKAATRGSKICGISIRRSASAGSEVGAVRWYSTLARPSDKSETLSSAAARGPAAPDAMRSYTPLRCALSSAVLDSKGGELEGAGVGVRASSCSAVALGELAGGAAVDGGWNVRSKGTSPIGRMTSR
eukprot:5868413-Pleurochrysis_carterae.AAC.2